MPASSPPPPPLTRADALLAAIAGSTTVAIFVKDREGLYRFANRKLLDLWGLSADDVLGRTDFDLFDEDVAGVLRSNDLRVMRSRVPSTLEEIVEFGGEPRTYLSSKVPLIDAAGLVYGICGISTDITDRKQVEDALRESRTLFRTLADSAPVLIWMSGVDEGSVFFNRTWLEFTGRALGDQAGDGWQAGVHPDDRDALEMRARAFAERRPFQARFRLRRWDGKFRWMLDTGVPRFDPGGAYLGFVGSCTDVTDQTELETVLRKEAGALAEADERKDAFLAMLGHELRNPLAPLRSVVEHFRLRRDDLDEPLQRSVDIADRQLQHMKRLVDDLLDMAQITQDRVRLERTPVSLARVLAAALETVQPLFEQRCIRLEVRGDARATVVDADEVRLAQVFGNLLHNAAKFTPPGGSVTVTTESPDGWVEVSVRDTGIGIGSTQLESVFELFKQGEGDLARTQGGLGLGLALARKLLTLHGGTVTAESAGAGRGSIFRVRLPTLRDVSVPPRGAHPDARGEGLAGERRRVLVVDDHVDAAHGLSTLVGLLGHEVTTVHDGEKALQEDLHFHPDVIFLDIGMPDLDGFEVGRRIRARGGSQPVLVALTGFGQESARERIVQIGFDHHVLKPIDGSTIQQILEATAQRLAPRGE